MGTGEFSAQGRAPPRAMVLDDTYLYALRNAPLPAHQEDSTTQLTTRSEAYISITIPQREEKKIAEKKNLLIDWNERMMALVWMHKKSFEYFRTIALCIMIPAIVFSTASGAMSLIDSRESSKSDRRSVDGIVLGAMSLTSAALSTVYQFLHLGERQTLHSTIASDFEKLCRKISVQMVLAETDERTYVNLAEFIKNCNEEYDQLTNKMPHVPDFVVTRFLNRGADEKALDSMYLHV